MTSINVVRAELATPEISSSSSSSLDSGNGDNMSDLKIKIEEKLTGTSNRRFLNVNANNWNEKKPILTLHYPGSIFGEDNELFGTWFSGAQPDYVFSTQIDKELRLDRLPLLPISLEETLSVPAPEISASDGAEIDAILGPIRTEAMGTLTPAKQTYESVSRDVVNDVLEYPALLTPVQNQMKDSTSEASSLASNIDLGLGAFQGMMNTAKTLEQTGISLIGLISQSSSEWTDFQDALTTLQTNSGDAKTDFTSINGDLNTLLSNTEFSVLNTVIPETQLDDISALDVNALDEAGVLSTGVRALITNYESWMVKFTTIQNDIDSFQDILALFDSDLETATLQMELEEIEAADPLVLAGSDLNSKIAMLTIQLFPLKDSIIALLPMLESINIFMPTFANDLYNTVATQEENEEDIQNQIDSALSTWFNPTWDTAFQELPTWCEDFGGIFIIYGETSIVDSIQYEQTKLDYDLNQFLDQLTAYTIEIGKISSEQFFCLLY